MARRKHFEIAAFILWPIFASIVGLLIEMNYWESALLYAILPSIYLTFRIPTVAKKVVIFTIPISWFGIIIFDYIGHATDSWYIETIFETRFLGLIPWESFIWAPAIIYFIIMFYEYFLDRHLPERLYEPRMRYFVPLCLFTGAIAIIAFSLLPSNLNIPYFYLISGTIFFVTPILFELYEHPRYLRKMAEATAYYFYFGVLYEITALKTGVWYFPGSEVDYLGWVHIAGVSFPIEELFFWLLLFGMAVLVLFDFWDDYQNH